MSILTVTYITMGRRIPSTWTPKGDNDLDARACGSRVRMGAVRSMPWDLSFFSRVEDVRRSDGVLAGMHGI